MKSLAFVAVVLALGLLPTRSHAQNTGIDLQQECRAVSISQPTPFESMQSAHCLGYIAGAAYMLSLVGGPDDNKQPGYKPIPVCLPDKGSTQEYIEVILHYLDEHPNMLHESYGYLVWSALFDAYPCKVAPK